MLTCLFQCCLLHVYLQKSKEEPKTVSQAQLEGELEVKPLTFPFQKLLVLKHLKKINAFCFVFKIRMAVSQVLLFLRLEQR